ncbi:MAG: ECF transporter S component, partial [Promethearchaeota archaeon]
MANNSDLEFNEESKNEQECLSRTIFLNLFISIFMIICYFYIAEFFGSISTIFIKNTQFITNIIIPLLIYSFFSTLAGKFHGFVAGFIGEFIYQIAYYDRIYIHWCFIIAIFGFLCGLYKYRPLMYQEKKNIIFVFLSLFISTLITT